MKKLMLGIKDEYEGEMPLRFDLEDPQVIADYFKDNVELDEKKIVMISMIDPEELIND